MLYLYTLFDSSRDGRPLISGFRNSKNNKTRFVTFYAPKSGRCLYDIDKDIELLSKVIISADNVVLNDAKQHCIAFDCSVANMYDVPTDSFRYDNINESKAKIINALDVLQSTSLMSWHKIRGDASVVYAKLQERGYIYNHTPVTAIWSLNTYSGRSKTSGFNIQGQTDSISNPNGGHIYINFDWVAADFRAAAIMSKDKKLLSSYNGDSDPYKFMAEAFNRGNNRNFTRSESKVALLSSVYSMDDTSPATAFYDGFRNWMIESRETFKNTRSLCSILGRRFSVSKDKDERSIFNATIQGSVAHAIQRVMWLVWDRYPDNVLLENQDSLVMTCNDIRECKRIVYDVAGIMVQPFNGILPENPMFPLIVSVGLKYRCWKRKWRFNNVESIKASKLRE